MCYKNPVGTREWLFLTLSKSYRELQGENGLWHQVLTDRESYEEASCTAMFIYAFCKGIKNGWYGEDTFLYLEAARKGYQGLTEYCIDRNGPVYAVCKGSRFSFTKEYYRDELFWITNDNHGIGIVLLAGNELLEAEQLMLFTSKYNSVNPRKIVADLKKICHRRKEICRELI